MSTLIRKYGISLLLLVAIGTALNHPAVAQQLVGRIVASVNDDAITDFDIDARSRLLLASSNNNKSTAEFNRVKRTALNELIDERLKLQEAKRLGIEATENEIKAAISTIEKNNKKQPGGIFQELTQLGVPIDTFVQRIKATVVWRKVLRQRVVPEVKIASAEVKDAVQKVEASEDKTLVRIAEIFLPFENDERPAVTLDKIKDLRDKATSTQAFIQLAKLHSRAPTASVGGDLGEIELNAFEPKLREGIKSLKPGETSVPIELTDGVYILHMIAERKMSELTSSKETVTLAQAFAKIPSKQSPKVIGEHIKKIVGTANDCDSFDMAAKSFNPRQPPRIINANVSQLPYFIKRYVKEMEPGQQTPALPINGGVVVLMLCERNTVALKPPSEQAIAETMQLERIERQAQSYLRDLRRLALIEING